MSMNSIDTNINDQREDKLKKFYDAFCGALELNPFFSHINNVDSSSEERARLNLEISDFEYFSKHYWVIQKWFSYYVVRGKEYVGTFTESTENINQSMIVTMLTWNELQNFKALVNPYHWEIIRAITDLINLKD